MNAEKLNWLRAGVLGAQDGIVTVGSTILGFTGAGVSFETLLLAGFIALIAGAVSMGAGEYVSVAAQNDSIYANEHNTGSPMGAVASSGLAFVAGGTIPLSALFFVWVPFTTALFMVAAMGLTGLLSARVSSAPVGRAVVRNITCGSLAAVITYVVGTFAGVI